MAMDRQAQPAGHRLSVKCLQAHCERPSSIQGVEWQGDGLDRREGASPGLASL